MAGALLLSEASRKLGPEDIHTCDATVVEGWRFPGQMWNKRRGPSERKHPTAKYQLGKAYVLRLDVCTVWADAQCTDRPTALFYETCP